VVAAACREPERTGAAANEVVVALENAPTNLDPRVGADQSSARLFDLFSSGLVRTNERGDLEPDLARRWEVDADGRRYRFFLDPQARFHDGRRLTASDVAWTFNSLLDGTVTSAKRGSLGPLSRVEVVDASTVDFLLDEPWGSLLVNLTAGLGIVPAGVRPAEMNAKPVGSGPFRVVERSADRVVLEAWEDARGGRPVLDRVVLRAVPDATVRALELEKGSVHLVVNGLPPDTVALFSRRPGFRVVQAPGSNYVYLGFNLEDPVLADRRVRQAIALAVDRGRLVRTLWRGLGDVTETLVPPGHWARNDDLPPRPYDPELAQGLLDQAGLLDPDGDGPEPRVRLVYKTSTDATARLQAQVIQAMLADVGIGLEIRSYEFATFFGDVKRGAFQLYSLTWTGVSDPDLYRYVLHSRSIPPAGANRNRYRSHAFDRAVDEAARRVSIDERRALYREAQEIVHRDLPYLSLFTKHTVAVMPVGLEGYVSYPTGELHALRRMSWR